MQRNVRDIVVLFSRGGIEWLLRDEFSDTRAAGAVNGTPATPGPGTRQVAVDTGSNLSIASGVLTMAITVASGDPAFYEQVGGAGFTRQIGQVFVFRTTTPNATNRNYVVGVSDSITPTSTDIAGFYFVIGGILSIIYRQDGAAGMTVDTWAASTVYDLAIVVGNARWYPFWKTGASNWTLLGAQTYAALATTNWPALAAVSAANPHGATFDKFRIPDALWLPQPLAFDSFSR